MKILKGDMCEELEKTDLVLCQEKVELKNDLFSSFYTTRRSAVIMSMNQFVNTTS